MQAEIGLSWVRKPSNSKRRMRETGRTVPSHRAERRVSGRPQQRATNKTKAAPVQITNKPRVAKREVVDGGKEWNNAPLAESVRAGSEWEEHIW